MNKEEFMNSSLCRQMMDAARDMNKICNGDKKSHIYLVGKGLNFLRKLDGFDVIVDEKLNLIEWMMAPRTYLKEGTKNVT